MVAMQMATENVAPPPVGMVRDFADLKTALLKYVQRRSLKPGDWILGSGYDESMLAEKRHPTRADLDKISTDYPILLVHVSGHLGTCNSLALERFGITAETPNPPGGIIQRVMGTNEPNGVLEEHAFMLALPKLPELSSEEGLLLLAKAQELYASMGHTTVQDGATTVAGMNLLTAAAEKGLLKMDVVAYPLWTEVERYKDRISTGYHGRLKVGGVKLVLDGSPTGKTAWLTKPYLIPPLGQMNDYRGYPAMSAAEAREWVTKFFGNGWQVLAHTNGDAASDQFIDAIEAAQTELGKPGRRPVMVHAQMAREDQLDRMKKLGITPSFFPAHTYYWGDWYRDSVLGPPRADRISPIKSALSRGMRFTIHNDAPIVPPDILRLLWSTVTRTTRSGAVLGPNQRVNALEALKGVTINAAYQNFEEAEKGSIEVGKRANFVILSANPFKIDPTGLADLQVVETLVDGKSIYRHPAAALNAAK